MGDLFFCGDTHGEFQHVIDAVKLHQPVAIIFLGDLQAKRPLEVELEEIIDLTEVWLGSPQKTIWTLSVCQVSNLCFDKQDKAAVLYPTLMQVFSCGPRWLFR